MPLIISTDPTISWWSCLKTSYLISRSISSRESERDFTTPPLVVHVFFLIYKYILQQGGRLLKSSSDENIFLFLYKIEFYIIFVVIFFAENQYPWSYLRAKSQKCWFTKLCVLGFYVLYISSWWSKNCVQEGIIIRFTYWI